MLHKIAVIPGDGIGPDVVKEALGALVAVGDLRGHKFEFAQLLMGGAAFDATGKRKQGGRLGGDRQTRPPSLQTSGRSRISRRGRPGPGLFSQRERWLQRRSLLRIPRRIRNENPNRVSRRRPSHAERLRRGISRIPVISRSYRFLGKTQMIAITIGRIGNRYKTEPSSPRCLSETARITETITASIK